MDYHDPKVDQKIDHLVMSEERVASLRKLVIGLIPSKPGDDQVRKELLDMSINSLVTIYMNWVDRFIPPRKRRVMGWDGFEKRNNPKQFSSELNELIKIINEGGNLKPYLSEKILKECYSPLDTKKKGINWMGKDMALNAYDVHHLHLVPINKNGNRKGQSKELLFVGVSRDEVLFIMLGDHKSFDDGSLREAVSEYHAQSGNELIGVAGLASNPINEDKSKLTRRGINTIDEIDGKFLIPAMLSTTGTAVAHTRHADFCCKIIEEFEPLLHERPKIIKRLGIQANELPNEPIWEWSFWYADLILSETISGKRFLMASWRR
ncbi:hypothetical protein F9L33_14595 [Amylibacter sp. SFDW26]|uniref:hypothetical protein n=1 Tax=Amylibacter sp. SFDW26 TaxID=2652722 RepID=UPI0012615E8B|nr:hypothetical protein [Amylibacter sp. SFDW26]KAB7610122.1 hypothetical protein F9L33_14595 [Amylibacter sp. SFDW26]